MGILSRLLGRFSLLSETSSLVFISHSSEDTWVARQIAREISLKGAKPFLDEADIEIGSDFVEVILKNIENSIELLVLYTPWAAESDYVKMEIGAASSLGKRISVVLHGISVEDFKKPKEDEPSYMEHLKKTRIIKLNDIDQYFKQLEIRVASEGGKND